MRQRILRQFIPLTIMLVSSLPTTGQCRWATEAEFDYRIDFDSMDVSVKKDGSSVETFENQFTVLREGGKRRFTAEQIDYEASSSIFKLLSASVTNGDQVTNVDPKSVQDKEVANSKDALSSRRQVTIAFPNVSLGSKVRYRFTLTHKNPEIKGLYTNLSTYGYHQWEAGATINIDSEIPIYRFTYLSQKEALWTETIPPVNGVSSHYKFSAKLLKPVHYEPVDERGAVMEWRHVPYLQISTMKNWGDLAKAMNTQWEKALGEPLPPVLEGILREASAKSTALEKIDLVTQRLSEKINYLGDWRTSAGRIYPKKFTEVISKGTGDCKDFSAITASLLRKLNIDAHVALVRRGSLPEYFAQPYFGLPTLEAFNHAFVKAIVDGKTLWIDPTNLVSQAGHIFEDIAGRPALVISEKTVGLERTPELNPQDSQIITDKTVSFTGSKTTHVSGKIKISGGAAAEMMTLGTVIPKATLEKVFMAIVGAEQQDAWHHVDEVDLGSKVVHDLNINFEVTGETEISKGKQSYVLSAEEGVAALLTNTERRQSDLFVGSPGIIQRSYLLKNVNLSRPEDYECWIFSPWVDASRRVVNTGSDLKLVQEVKIKKPVVSAGIFNRFEFEKLQYDILSCFTTQRIPVEKQPQESDPDETKAGLSLLTKGQDILREISQKSTELVAGLAPLVKPPADEDAIDKLIRQARGSNKLLKARDMALDRVAADPKDAEGYRQLGDIVFDLGYFNGENTAAEYLKVAKQYLDYSLFLDATSSTAHASLGLVLQRLGQYGNAEMHYRQALKLQPTEGRTEALYADLLRDNKDYEKALVHAQKAVALSWSPIAQAQRYQNLGNIYGLLKENTEAEDAYKKSVKVGSSDAWIVHNYALFLQSAKKYDESIEQSLNALKIKDFGAAHTVLASSYFYRGTEFLNLRNDPKNAIEDYTRAIENNKNNAETYFMIARAYDALSKQDGTQNLVEKIRENLLHCISIDPNHQAAKAMLEGRLPASDGKATR